MVSPRKSATSVSSSRLSPPLMAETKSCESLFSASSRESACQIYQRKPQSRSMGMRPANGSGHIVNGGRFQPTIIPNSSDIHQRVMSARNLRKKTFQNQLADAQTEIANLAHENRMLRTLHKRQSSALSKYESNNAELPQLLHSHAEELRVWQTKHRNMQALNKELEQKLKQKEALILSLSDQNKHYSQLNKDKNLDERHKLQEKLRNLEQRLVEKDNDMKLMARKVQLESKNFRQQLLNEQKKSKDVMLKLEKARLEISGYRKLEEFAIGVDKSNPLSSAGRRPRLVVEDNDKMDKLEKSVETLEKAIEKNNQSEFNALTDVLETDSLFDFEKVLEDDMEHIVDDVHDVQITDNATNKDNKQKRSGNNMPKLTLPQATVQSKQMTSPIMRSSLSQALSNKTMASKSDLATGKSRLRSGTSKNESYGGNVNSVRSSAAARRGDLDAAAKLPASELKGKPHVLKSLEMYAGIPKEYEYDDGFEIIGEDEAEFGLTSEADGVSPNKDDDDEDNANETSLVNFAAYLEAKTADLDDMTEDEDEQVHEQVHTKKEALLPKANSRSPNMKEDISSIRKQISDDYKERESFLNTFCRQASGSNMRDDPALKKRNSIAASATNSHMTGSRKHALLAALKNIDDNKSQD